MFWNLVLRSKFISSGCCGANDWHVEIKQVCIQCEASKKCPLLWTSTFTKEQIKFCIGAIVPQLLCHERRGLRGPWSLFGLKENVDFRTAFVGRLGSVYCLLRFHPYGAGEPRIFFKKCNVHSEVKWRLLVEKYIYFLFLKKQINCKKTMEWSACQSYLLWLKAPINVSWF